MLLASRGIRNNESERLPKGRLSRKKDAFYQS